MQNQGFYLVARHTERKLAAMQELNERTTNLDMTLKPAMSISGRVQDPKGKPVAKATAYAMLHLENSSFQILRQPIQSDEQGRLQAEALPLGEHYGWFVSAHGFGTSQQEMEGTDPKADHYDFPPLTLKQANLKLAGRVLGPNGTPAAGVQVWMNGDGQPNGNAMTDADGRFAYDAVCAGPVMVSANAQGANGSVEAMGGDTNVVIRLNARNNNFAEASRQTVTGTVLDPSGHRAVGVPVVVTPSWGMMDNATTDANGDFSTTWQPQQGMRNVRYFVVARDVERNLAAIETIDTHTTNVDLRLAPGLAISGTVLDMQGAPLVHANVNLNIMAGNMGGLIVYEQVKQNSEGAFTIPALPMGQQYNLYVTAKGYGSAHRRVGITQNQTNNIQFSPFRLKNADRQLAGRVVDGNDKALAGAQVNINGDGQPNGNMRTDENGHFEFKVCDGPITIYGWSQSGGGQNGSVQARGGDTDVVLKMGVRQQPRQFAQADILLQPPAWTLGALVGWPTEHKTGMIILLSVQAAVLLGTSAGIFWFTRKRG
jgi:protocatechuate 3,4-dioxygenase beta subunit